MDVESYDLLLVRTKEFLQFDTCRKAFITSQLSSAVAECDSCVIKGLELITMLLEDTNVEVNKLCCYIEDVICLLQMLSGFVKNVIESTAMPCCDLKPFPTTTGNIIISVFVHCKESECIYGDYLKHVKTQLKDLFRTCHELQLTYLMTLEKHLIFDLSEKDEQDILIEAVHINMRIGEIVQFLDVKTMAEQWKAFTVICEKYSNFLQDKDVFNKCTRLFATSIKDNIKTAMESEQDSKNIVRSLKVANFIIKILSRISDIFKHAVTSCFEHVVDLMVYIYSHNTALLELTGDKAQQFMSLVEVNILNPTDSLCVVLLQDERFLNCINNLDLQKMEAKTFLGYTVLVIALIKGTIQRNQDTNLDISKENLISCVYRILPLGHYWFNMEHKFQSSDGADHVARGLYEHLLVHAVAFASTFQAEQYNVLENRIYEALLSTDCYSAMFSSNLWVLLVRVSNDQLAFTTTSSLLSFYQKLEKHDFFHSSPQKVHLRLTIGKLFETLSNEHKRQISGQLHPQHALWSILRVSSMPDQLRRTMETCVLDNLRKSVSDLFESADANQKEIYDLIQTMEIAATCSFFENSHIIEEYLIKLWSKTCHKNEYFEIKDTLETTWFFKYLDALVSLTESTRLKSSKGKCKVLHNMSTLLCKCNTEILVMLFNLFCSITFDGEDDENQYILDSNFKDTFTVLLRGIETSFRPYLFGTLAKYKFCDNFHEVTSTIFNENESSMNEWNFHCYRNKLKTAEWRDQLIQVSDIDYNHKCYEVPRDIIEQNGTIDTAKSNFDLGNFLFDDSESEEPSRKKAKLDLNETESLIERLENDTSLLCQVEAAALSRYKKRIAHVIDTLANIVT